MADKEYLVIVAYLSFCALFLFFGFVSILAGTKRRSNILLILGFTIFLSGATAFGYFSYVACAIYQAYGTVEPLVLLISLFKPSTLPKPASEFRDLFRIDVPPDVHNFKFRWVRDDHRFISFQAGDATFDRLIVLIDFKQIAEAQMHDYLRSQPITAAPYWWPRTYEPETKYYTIPNWFGGWKINEGIVCYETRSKLVFICIHNYESER